MSDADDLPMEIDENPVKRSGLSGRFPHEKLGYIKSENGLVPVDERNAHEFGLLMRSIVLRSMNRTRKKIGLATISSP